MKLDDGKEQPMENSELFDREKLSAEIHKCYCRYYLKRYGKEYHTKGDYSKLDEETKDADREMADWVIKTFFHAERSHLVPLNELEVTKLLMKVKNDYDNLTDFEKVRLPIGGDGPRLYAEAICKTFGTPNIKCDHEIDREALINEIRVLRNGTYPEFNSIQFADHIISTMPQWLKRVENGKI